MCIVDQLTHPTCTHTTHLLLFPCTSGFSIFTKTCNSNNHITRHYLPSTSTRTQPSCRICYLSTLKAIRADYAKRYLALVDEVSRLGWSKGDVSGSLLDMGTEMEAEVRQWKGDCGVEGEEEEESLEEIAERMAEMISFSFSPNSKHTSVQHGKSSRSQTPFVFSAGDECKGKMNPLERAHSRTMMRAKARKAGMPWLGATCNKGRMA